MINEDASFTKVNIFTKALLPLKFLPKQFSFCFQSSNAAKEFGQRSGTSWWRVCYQRSLPCLVLREASDNLKRAYSKGAYYYFIWACQGVAFVILVFFPQFCIGNIIFVHKYLKVYFLSSCIHKIVRWFGVCQAQTTPPGF